MSERRMVSIKDYGEFETAWCPGCGNFGILAALKKALAELELPPWQVLLVAGIGQAAKAPHYTTAHMFNGLHGRSLPLATGARVADHRLKTIVMSGDGCHYAEGGNHFLHAIRRNPDLTVLVHDNQVYGLTKGQASPTSVPGFTNKAQPLGNFPRPLNPVLLAVAMDAAFVARGFAGMQDHLAELIKQAVSFRGLAVIDILQPCVSFNHVNTFAWYRERVYALPDDYNPEDREAALKTAEQWGDRIPLGIIYRNPRPVLEDYFPALQKGPLVDQFASPEEIEKIISSFA